MPKNVTKLNKGVISSGKVPRGKGTGVEGMRAATVKLKTVLAQNGGGTVFDGLGEEGEAARVAMLQKLGETDERGVGVNASVGLEVEKQIIVESVGGKTPVQIATEYGVHRNYVDNALRRRFGSPEKAKQVLVGLMLENSLALQESVARRIGEFSAPQAVLSSAIMVDKVVALERSIAETPKTIDFGALRKIGDSLQRLRGLVPKAPAG